MLAKARAWSQKHPIWRDWLGAAVLTLILVALVALLVTAAIPA